MQIPRRTAGSKRPRFFWQAILIVLPVVVLAGVAFLSLRQDKRLAQSEASERAQTIADELLNQLWTIVNQVNPNENLSGRAVFEVDAAGQLLFPPRLPEFPSPQPFELDQLKPDAARAWQAAQTAEARRNARAEVEKLYFDFLALNPPK